MAGGAVTENGAAGGGDFPLLRTISYFIYEMGANDQTGRGGSKGIHAQLPKIALRGDFSLVSLTIS